MKSPPWLQVIFPDAPAEKRCGNCEHFTDAPQVLEETFKGINALSSLYGCSRGDAGICLFHDQYLLPLHSCPDFLKKA
jgi:hypothetical protein